MKRNKGIAVSTAPLEPRLLGVESAAAYLGCAKWAVRTLAWQRKVPFIRIGRRILFDKADLDKFVEQQKAIT